MPAITSINFVMGSTQGGQLLEIKGTGFSTIMSNLTVIIGNTICNVIAASRESVTCITSTQVNTGFNPLYGNPGLTLDI